MASLSSYLYKSNGLKRDKHSSVYRPAFRKQWHFLLKRRNVENLQSVPMYLSEVVRFFNRITF